MPLPGISALPGSWRVTPAPHLHHQLLAFVLDSSPLWPLQSPGFPFSPLARTQIPAPVQPQPGKRQVAPRLAPGSAHLCHYPTCRLGYSALTPAGIPPRPQSHYHPLSSSASHPAPHCLRDAAPALPSTGLAPLPCPLSPTLSPTSFCLPHLPRHDHHSSPLSSAGELLFTPQGPTLYRLLMLPSQTTPGEGSKLSLCPQSICPFSLGCRRPVGMQTPCSSWAGLGSRTGPSPSPSQAARQQSHLRARPPTQCLCGQPQSWPGKEREMLERFDGRLAGPHQVGGGAHPGPAGTLALSSRPCPWRGSRNQAGPTPMPSYR